MKRVPVYLVAACLLAACARPGWAQEQPLADPAAAAAWYRTIAENPEAHNRDRIAALKNMADALIRGQAGLDLRQMDLVPAHAALKQALALPGLTPDEAAQAWTHIGGLFERLGDYEAARECYSHVPEVDLSPRARTAAARLIAGAWIAEGQVEPARALYEEYRFDPIELYQRLDRPDLRLAACERILRDPVVDPRLRWSAFTRLPLWDESSRDYAGIRAVCEEWLPLFMETGLDRALILLPKLKLAVKDNPAFTAWAAPLLLAAPKLDPDDYARVRMAHMHALAALGRVSDAAEAAAETGADEKLSAETRFQARLTADFLTADAREPMARRIEAAAAGFTLDELPAESQRDALLAAGRTLLAAGRETEARALYEAHADYRVPPPPAVAACRFLSRAPSDPGGWLASAIVQEVGPAARLERPCRAEQPFRFAADFPDPPHEPVGEPDEDTSFYAACDEDGIHLFFLARDARAAEVADGLLAGGRYWGGLASGPGQPSHTFIIDLPGGTLGEQTPAMYRHRGRRPAALLAGSVRTATRILENGFATYLFYGWELFYDKLPADGDAWPFETIRWTRTAGFSFGGSRSANAPSEWGSLVFQDLTPANLTAIKRRLVAKAAAAYRAERRTPGGLVDGWADRDLGDPVFFEKALWPLVAELDARAAEVSAAMNAADVERLFAEAVPGWMEFAGETAARRRAWLEKKLFAGE